MVEAKKSESYPAREDSRAVWRRLASWSPDEVDDALAFSDRLARENRWSTVYARRVIDEYRRFIFLYLTAGHPVTPPDEVDQAWHLHLLYTRAYWDDFCPNVARASIHHGPTRGGDAERTKFTDWYAKTIASYTTAFGEEPPRDIWPPPALRMRQTQLCARVSLGENFVVPRRWVRTAGIASVVALASLTLLTGCGVWVGASDWVVPAAVGTVAAVVVYSLIRGSIDRSRLRSLKKRIDEERDPARKKALQKELRSLRMRRRRGRGGAGGGGGGFFGGCGGCGGGCGG